MLEKTFVTTTLGNPITLALRHGTYLVEKINGLEPDFVKLTDTQLKSCTQQFRARLSRGETIDDLLVEAFAAVREASKRSLGMRHYDVQLIGGVLLHQGKITEMRTGEGKTLMATLPLYLNALCGRGSHLITANDYLARRDARWMYPIFAALGMSVGVLQLNTLDPSTPIGYLVDPSIETAFEATRHLKLEGRSAAYFADVTYGTCSEFGFDYLRDNLVMRISERVSREHFYAILDEVDNILIDEARTPLIISGASGENGTWYSKMAQIVRGLHSSDVDVDEKNKSVSLTDTGVFRVEDALGFSLRNPETPELITSEQEHISTFLEQALRAQFLYRAGVDYLVQGGKIVIVDDFTGRLVPGRRWADGLHQAVEAKEGVTVEPDTMTQAMITIQNFFRMYEKLAGMSGTAATESEEFYKIYKLDVMPLSSRLEYAATRPGSDLVLIEKKDGDGYPYKFYGRKGPDSASEPIFWVRQDFPDMVFRTEEAKLRAIVKDIVRRHTIGQPLLVGTTSVENSVFLSSRLSPSMLGILMRTVLIRALYLMSSGRRSSERSIALLRPLDLPLESIGHLVSGHDVSQFEVPSSIDPLLPANLDRLLAILNIPLGNKDDLVQILQNGVPHQVLNAKRHADEAKIIACAGAFKVVTVATNMAGRGVDIKLGGELDDDVIGIVNMVLEKTGCDAFGLSHEERLEAVKKLPTFNLGENRRQIELFRAFMDNMRKVKMLGGLHVIGSDRHEARRIDNQLRGRASRQGDPGSSRFYLSFEGDLLRKFGGDRMKAFTGILGTDESIPVEGKTISGVVTQTQVQVEGSNFDARKRLLEYDDVLNLQRDRIYAQRDQLMEKANILGDVENLLRIELSKRVPDMLAEKDGAWRLLQYLETILPDSLGGTAEYPSFAVQILIDDLTSRNPKGWESRRKFEESLLDLASRALSAEQMHSTATVNQIAEHISGEAEGLRLDLYQAVEDLFSEGRDVLVPANDLADFLQRLTKLSEENHFQSLAGKNKWATNQESLNDDLHTLVDAAVTIVALKRLAESAKRRVGINLSLDPAYMLAYKWDRVVQQLTVGLLNSFASRSQQLLGESGQIARDLVVETGRVQSLPIPNSEVLRSMLGRMAWENSMPGQQPAIRLNYIYLVSDILATQNAAMVQKRVIDHLNGALSALYRIYGRMQLGALMERNFSIDNLLPAVRTFVVDEIKEPLATEVAGISFADIQLAAARAIEPALGKWQMNEICRDYLLHLITGYWIEYLTKIEALRTSVSMESYAQKDPLNAYKRRAAEMFDELISDIRSALVRSLFNFTLSKKSEG